MWTPVKLVAHSDPKGDQLLVPRGTLDGFGASRGLPSLLLRLVAEKPGTPKVVTAEWIPAVTGQFALRASPQLLTSLAAPDVQYVSAEIRRATAFKLLRYDRTSQAYVLLTSAALLAAGWGVFSTADGEPTWTKIVSSALVVVAVVLGVLLKRRTGS